MSSHLVDSLEHYSISSNCYSLNSPDPTSVAANTSGPSSSSVSPSSASSSLPSPSPSSSSPSSSPRRKRTKSFTSSGFLAPPPLSHRFIPTPPTPPRSPARSPVRASTPPRSPVTPSHVLTTPDPANAVAAARQSVQFQPNGVNWSRPIPAVEVFPSIRIHRQRASLGSTAPWLDTPITSLSSTTSPPLDVVCEMTAVLPPGAAPPATCTDWKVKGLGMVGIDFEQHEGFIEGERQHSEVASSSASSRSSSEGSLAGDSVHTASSTTSSPATPTRLQFVSESFEARWNPATLDELRNLKKAAAELDMESRRLRCMRGREPAVSPRTLPRKAVPIVSAIDLAVKPTPRRPAVRHSLIASPHDSSSFALLVDPLVVPALSAVGPFRHSPAIQSAATRRPFYAQGKAAMSVIEFSPRKDPQASTSSSVFPPFSRSRQLSGTIPTLTSLRAERAERTAAAEHAAASMSISPPVATVAASSTTNLALTGAAPPPAPVCGEPSFSSPESSPDPSLVLPMAARLPPGSGAPVAFPGGLPPPPPPPPAARRGSTAADKPERTLSLKASSGFLNKHKKLSRFLGKTPVVSA